MFSDQASSLLGIHDMEDANYTIMGMLGIADTGTVEE